MLGARTDQKARGTGKVINLFYYFAIFLQDSQEDLKKR